VLPSVSRFAGFRRKARRHAEVARLAEELQSAQTELQRAAGDLEAQFLRTGSALELLLRESDGFVGKVEKLIGLATGKGCDGSIFTAAIELIERATSFLGDCEQETSRMLEHLREYNLQIEQLLGAEAELQRAMLPLSIVQTLFRMESAQLNVEVQQMFGSLTHEIGVLHGQMREIFGTKFKQLEQTHQTIGQVIGKLEEQVRLLRQVTSSRRAQIDASLTSLKKEMHNNVDRDVRLEQFSRAVAREVQEVVIGLQFQDIVNQKLQHVQEALPEIMEQARQLQPGAEDGNSHFVQQSCRLEAAQIQSARDELAGAEGKMRSGIEKVLVHAKEMDSHCLSLDEFTLLTTSFDGIVQVLVETIEEVRSVVGVTVANAAEAYGLLKPLGSLANDLTVVIRSMAGQIQLIGLNAQIKASQAAQDGQGTGLEVLSVRTREISEETNRIGQQAAGRLDALASGLAESVKTFEGLQARSRAQQTELDQEGTAREQQLHAIRDAALATLGGIGATLEALRARAEETMATIEFARFHEVVLPALQAPLRRLSEAMESWMTEDRQTVPATALVEGFKRHYTMASEREVFAGVVAARQPAATVAATELKPEPMPAPAAEPILFEAEPVRPAAPAETMTAILPEAATAPPTKVDINFGDNAELF
jgi:hypothetical protein